MAIRQVTSRSIKDGEIVAADIATQTGNVDFADNGRIRFGNSQDLQIYHTGSASYISDTGTGDLNIYGTNIALRESDGTYFFYGDSSTGVVSIRHNGNTKLSTTSTGVDVTGDIGATTGTISTGIQLGNGTTDGYILVEGGTNTHNDLVFQSKPSNGSAIERMRIDTSGNVGISNTTPSSFFAGARNLVVGSGSGNQGMTIFSGTSSIGNIKFADGTGSDAAKSAGGIRYDHNSNFMRFDTNDGSERMRITSGGTLAIATTLPESQAKLQANGPAIFIHNHTDTSSSGNVSYLAGNQALTLVNAQAGANNRCVKLGFSVPTLGANSDGLIEYGSTAAGSGEFRFYTESGNTLANRMTLDSNGRIGLNRAATSGFRQSILSNGAVEYQLLCQTSNTSGTQYHIAFYRDGTSAGYITTNQNNQVFLNSGSDYRLKENISDMTDGIERVKQLQPKKFSFISNPDKEIVDGFLAHEVKDLVPQSVLGEKDAVDDDGNPIMQTIDVSTLIPVLTAALKESIAKIETLETRLEALENA